MGFFVHSNTLEIRLTNLRGQDSLKEVEKLQMQLSKGFDLIVKNIKPGRKKPF